MALEAIPSAPSCAFLAVEPECAEMADFQVPEYSKKLVVKAGKALCEPMPVTPDRVDEYLQVFRIAHDWRTSHAYPMRVLRQDLRTKIRALRVRGVTAARMKRMSSIRKKLARLNVTLAQIQDIGGCRAIVESSETLNALIEQYRRSNSSKIRLDKSYIENPRGSGYRSHHFVFDFQPQTAEEEPFRDRRIEMQLRTRLQHAWATAVEAIGLDSGQDLKASEGNADWLRFFELVSSEFAEFENSPLVPNAPSRAERLNEIKRLDNKLGAINRLESLNQSFNFVDSNTNLGSKYFLLQFDSINRSMQIVGYSRISSAAAQYDIAEQSGHLTTVVVEVDKVESLREAYPNYFLDVRLFTQNVLKALRGEPMDLVMRKQDLEKTAHGYDLSWLRTYQPARGRR